MVETEKVLHYIQLFTGMGFEVTRVTNNMEENTLRFTLAENFIFDKKSHKRESFEYRLIMNFDTLVGTILCEYQCETDDCYIRTKVAEVRLAGLECDLTNKLFDIKYYCDDCYLYGNSDGGISISTVGRVFCKRANELKYEEM